MLGILNTVRNQPCFYSNNSSFPKLRYGTEGAKLYPELIKTTAFHFKSQALRTLTVSLLQIIKCHYKWYAIYTRSRSENKLYQELVEMGVECYLPLKKELRVWSDRKKWVESPLFASYVFVRVSEREYYQVIQSTWAVRYVSFGGKALVIPELQIEGLKSLLADQEREVEVSSRNFKKGDQLEVTSGPLQGVLGELIQIRGQQRLVLRFESLGCCVHAEISVDEVKPQVHY